jgi:hypothetical protein
MKKNLLTSLLLFIIGVQFANAQSTVYLSSVSGSYSIIEGTTYSFNVNLYSVSATPIVVDITTVLGTANTSDCTPITTTVTIPAGQLSSSTSLSIPTTNDSTIEPSEFFTINGSITSGNTTNSSVTTTVLIIDNDTVPTVTTSYYNNTMTVNEGSIATVYYSLSNPYSSNVVLNCVTATGTAGSADFTAVNSTITIPAGQTQVIKTILITNDALTEPDESFTLTGTITSGNTINSAVIQNITIIDNDTNPTLSVYGFSTVEGGSATAFLQLNRPFNANVTVQVTTSNGTAGSADYTAITTNLTIFADQLNANFYIPLTDDTVDEPIENFTVTANVTSGNTTNPSASGTISIIDNDGFPDFSIEGNSAAASYLEVEEGQDVSFLLGLSQPNPANTVVQITTANGTAGSADYTSLTTTATIPAGQTYFQSPTFTIPTVLDQLQEGDETFTITATVISGNTYNSIDSTTATIIDNYNLNAQPDSFRQ